MISSNEVYYDGGGIWNRGTLRIYESYFHSNFARINGGGIFSEGGTVTISDTRIISNRAGERTFGSGGGISHTGGQLRVSEGSRIARNHAWAGGGIASDSHETGASVLVSGSNVMGNVADIGGGIMSSQASLVVERTSVIENHARDGGGIYKYYGPTRFTNITVSINHGQEWSGAGISNYFGEISIYNSTIYNKDAWPYARAITTMGGIVYFQDTIVGTPFEYFNCVNWGSGIFVSMGFNLEDGDSCGFHSTGDQAFTNAMLDGGPGLDHGTYVHALMDGSPAIDNASDECPATDQRGIDRPQGPGCDIGAYEASPAYIILPPAPASVPAGEALPEPSDGESESASEALIMGSCGGEVACGSTSDDLTIVETPATPEDAPVTTSPTTTSTIPAPVDDPKPTHTPDPTGKPPAKQSPTETPAEKPKATDVPEEKPKATETPQGKPQPTEAPTEKPIEKPKQTDAPKESPPSEPN